MQPSEGSVARNQLRYRSPFDDASLLDYRHVVHQVGEHRQAMGDEQHAAPMHQPVYGREEFLLGDCVQTLGRFIENEKGGVFKQRAGDGDAAGLAARKPGSRLAEFGVVALGEAQR